MAESTKLLIGVRHGSSSPKSCPEVIWVNIFEISDRFLRGTPPRVDDTMSKVSGVLKKIGYSDKGLPQILHLHNSRVDKPVVYHPANASRIRFFRCIRELDL